MGANGLDCGPVVSTDSAAPTRPVLVWSTLDAHKIIPQKTGNGVYKMGVAAAIPTIPSGYAYSVLFSATTGAWNGVFEMLLAPAGVVSILSCLTCQFLYAKTS